MNVDFVDLRSSAKVSFLIQMTENNTIEIVTKLLAPVLPVLMLLLGGQIVMNRYQLRHKQREQEIELIKTVRQKQYDAVERLYSSFAKFMSLYRLVNDDSTDLKNTEIRQALLAKAIEAEAEIDALILRIGCEFESEPVVELESLLGHLRQSVQLWREQISKGNRLPFYSSQQPDYVRFKESFAGIAAFMIHQIHNRMDTPKMRMAEARNLLMGTFHNKYETQKFEDSQNKKGIDIV